MIKKLLLIFAFVNISLASATPLVVPGTFVLNGINYEINGLQSVKVIANVNTGYTGSITIPSIVSYNDEQYTVTEIGESAFANSSELNSVSIPESVTSIGSYAFSNCSYLRSVNIPSFVTTIANDTFKGCYYLFSIILPKDITSIGDNAFKNCYHLSQVTSKIETALAINSTVFENVYLENCKLIVPTGKKEPYELDTMWGQFSIITDVTPFIVDAVAYEITSDSQLATVKVVLNTENSTTSSIRIPKTLTYNDVLYTVTGITPTAFNGYYELKQITCDIENPLVITEETLYNIDVETCRLIVPTASLDLYRNADGWKEFLKITDVPPFVVDGISYEITSTTASATVEVVKNTESNYSGSLTIPSTVTSNNITYNITSINPEAFKFSEELTAISIGDNINVIPQYAFENCTSLTTVHIGSTVTSIEKAAFAHCESLTTINIPTSVTSIGKEAFSYCTALTALEVPNSTTYIGDYAFNSSGLTSFTFPNNITEVTFAVLTGCKSLTTVTIPASVQSIKQYAFNFCPKLKLVTCNIVSPLDIDNTVFSGSTPIYSGRLIVPTDSVDDYKNAAQWEEFYVITDQAPIVLNNISYDFTSSSTVKVIASLAQNYSGSVTIPASVNVNGQDYLVTAIGENAFAGVYDNSSSPFGKSSASASISSITSITIGENVTSIEDYAFVNCANLVSITCLNPNVVAINATVFDGVDQSNCSLTVPSNSLATYKAAAVWKDFSPLTASSTLAVTNFSITNNVSVYPNPVYNELMIAQHSANKASIQLFDTTGRVLIHQTVSDTENSIDTSSLSKGIYFIKISTTEGTIIKKVLKN